MSKSLYFVAGEASGDGHGAALMIALRKCESDLRFIGRGGPRMQAEAAPDFIDWSENSAVLGLTEVLKQYGYFRRQFHATIEQIREQRPSAVVLIDYPGFNLRLARALRARLPELKIIYYISPQVWAWNRRRIPKMARYLDVMLCIFPFEAELYNKSGLRTIFVGHPMIEDLREKKISGGRTAGLVGLFPGSRRREIRKIFPPILRAAQHILSERPDAKFEIGAASARLTSEINLLLRASSFPKEKVKVVPEGAASLMQRAEVGIVASGTATLEAAYFRLPFVLVYRVAWATYFAGRMVVKVKHLGMPNVLAGREIIPEFVQHRAQPRAIADAVLRLLQDKMARSMMISEFDAIIASLGEEGASGTAARAILQEIRE